MLGRIDLGCPRHTLSATTDGCLAGRHPGSGCPDNVHPIRSLPLTLRAALSTSRDGDRVGRHDLQAEFCRTGDTGLLDVDGDLDILTVPALRAALDSAVATMPDITVVVIDLDGVLFCGARGLVVLIDAADTAAERGGRVVLARRPAIVRRLMELLAVPTRPHALRRPPDPAAVELLPRSVPSCRPTPLR